MTNPASRHEKCGPPAEGSANEPGGEKGLEWIVKKHRKAERTFLLLNSHYNFFRYTEGITLGNNGRAVEIE